MFKIFKGFKDEGEGFLAARAAGTPEANRRISPATCFCMNLWQDFFAEKGKIIFVTVETGFGRRDGIEKNLFLVKRPVSAQVLVVI